MVFSEYLLHFAWQFRLYEGFVQRCAGGEELRIISPGLPNQHAGPDFSAAKIDISGVVWVGDVEIHIRSSDWLLHGHQHDAAYDTVILHVVYEHDQEIYRHDGTLLPVLALKDLLSAEFLSRYEQMILSIDAFPCAAHFGNVPSFIVRHFLSGLMVERLEMKADQLLEKVALMKGDWEEAFYQLLAKSFGFKVNEVPFELLAGVLPQKMLLKHLGFPLQIEALVFGQAGFLSGTFKDPYPLSLQKEYRYLKKKYTLRPIDVSAWKFLRMRPQNFPTRRLAQFCGFIVQSRALFSRLLEIDNVQECVQLLSEIPVQPYWEHHYHFQKEAKKSSVKFGMPAVYHLLINVVCVQLYAYGKHMGQPLLMERALSFLEQMPSEKNAVTRLYEECGMVVAHASDSQGLLQLNKFYCRQKKCLNCDIGIKILNK